MDLSLRTTSSPPPKSGEGMVPIVRPVPRPPWSILWYQNLWSLNNNPAGESSGAVTNNEENRNHSDCSSAPISPSLQHSHRLYRLSMAAFTSDRCYPESCHKQYKETLDEGSQPHLKKIFECSMVSDGDGGGESENDNDSETSDSIVVTTSTSDETGVRPGSKSDLTSISLLGQQQQTTVVLDIACCDGPVQFKRISNPNFAVTVEHSEVSTPMDTAPSTMSMFQTSSKGHSSSSSANVPSAPAISTLPERKYMPSAQQFQSHSQKCGTQWTTTNEDGHSSPPSTSGSGNHSTLASTLKSYLCIYCNQSFKSLFCYQKHKKRHLNPVSVDITTTIPSNSTSLRDPSGTGSSKRAASRNASAGGGVRDERRQGAGVSGTTGILPDSTKAKTKDLNVQFFPCKKCGCKFPSYYFVHKHRKICH